MSEQKARSESKANGVRRTDPLRILVRAPTWVGDAVMATPALRALRAAQPAAQIVLEGRFALAGLFEGLASVDEFLPDPGRGAGALASRVRALRARHFDWAVLLPDSVRAALGPFLARIPRRSGHARDPLQRALLTEALPLPRSGGRRRPLPTVERYLRITRQLGCPDRGLQPELVVNVAARERVAARLAAAGVGAAARVALVTPGASFGPSKRWPPAYFASTCDALESRLGLRAVLAPAPGEAELAQRVAALAARPLVSLLDPPLDLSELVALVERATLLLSNDTGPRHVAAALGTPAVVLMGPTHPLHSEYAAPRERVLREDLPCSPCQRRVCPIDHRCMTRLEPERALEAARQLA